MRSLSRIPFACALALAAGVALLSRGDGALAAASPHSEADPAAARADTVLEVSRGDIVRIDLREGEVVIEGVEGRLLEVYGESRRGLEVARNGGRVSLRIRGRDRGAERMVRLGVPSGVQVWVEGEEVDVASSGLEGPLRVRVVEGDIRVAESVGAVEVRTVDGDVDVSDVEGMVDASTVDGWVRLARIRGTAYAQTMDGDLVLDDVDGAEVSATTVDGDVTFDGPLSRGTQVELVTHDGDVVVSVPTDASADVEVSTFEGEFVPAFPVRVGRVEAGQPLRFRLGDGGARLGVQVFDGDIQLRHRPGR